MMNLLPVDETRVSRLYAELSSIATSKSSCDFFSIGVRMRLMEQPNASHSRDLAVITIITVRVSL